MMTDLTSGKPARQIIAYALPMLLSVLFQQLYNMADSAIAGLFSGKNALAAVGASAPVTMIFIAVAVGMNMGCMVVISRLFGGRELAKMKTAIYTAMFASIGAALLLTGIGQFACAPILRLLQTDADIFADAKLYLYIYIYGLVFLFLYNICTGIFAALGDSKTPLYFLIASSLSNILLDFVFVYFFGWGVAGVAWATFICQGICSVLSVLCLLRRLNRVPVQEPYPRFSWEMLMHIMRYSVPSILQQSFVSVGNLFVQGLVNGFGVDAIAAFSAAAKLNAVVVTLFNSMGNSISGFTAQNLGANKPERVRLGHRAGIGMMTLLTLPVAALFFVWGPSCIGMFMNAADANNAQAIALGARFLRVVAPFYPIISIKIISDGVLRGGGVMHGFMISTFVDLLLRVVLSFLLAAALWFDALAVSWVIGWLSATIYSYMAYRHMWKAQRPLPDGAV
ncbi:MAG: MATE family efflux transporter [Christensenellaceae bacterium]|jgi:putative MATE family efflux protein|nr:MATE family efflux transporter [Christensenellaceae bacterium]